MRMCAFPIAVYFTLGTALQATSSKPNLDIIIWGCKYVLSMCLLMRILFISQGLWSGEQAEKNNP